MTPRPWTAKRAPSTGRSPRTLPEPRFDGTNRISSSGPPNMMLAGRREGMSIIRSGVPLERWTRRIPLANSYQPGTFSFRGLAPRPLDAEAEGGAPAPRSPR